ncbi:transposase [Holospora curviuscula]|uniref:transposase n=1 Tax=Holospora curviuscula TaxID=1082868 RepID=UPI000CE594E3
MKERINERKEKQVRPQPKDARRVWSGIVYITKNGWFWRDLPKAFGLWKSVLNDFTRLTHRGIIQAFMNKPRDIVIMKRGKEQSPSIGIIDIQSVNPRAFK